MAMLDEKTLEFLNSWYGGHNLPPFGKEFYDFFLKSKVIANVFIKGSDFTVHAVDRKRFLASVNSEYYRDNNMNLAKDKFYVINISINFFSKLFYSEYPDNVSRQVALGVLNGVLIHEALHVYCDSLDFFDMAIASDDLKPFFNIVEDIFIEQYCSDFFPNLFPFVTAMRAAIRSDVNLALTRADLVTCYIDPYNRNNPVFSDDPFLKKCVEILSKINSKLDLKERVEVAFELRRLFGQEKEKPPENAESRTTESDHRQTNDYILRKIDRAKAAIGKGSAKEIAESNSEILKKSHLDFANFIVKSNSEFKDIAVKLHDINDFVNWKAGLEIDPDVIKVGDSIAVFYDYIGGLDIGAKPKGYVNNKYLSNLHDGRIFSPKANKGRAFTPPEVLLLIDSSGSMEQIYHRVVQFAYNMCFGMKRARINFKVYAHTGSTSCLVYRITNSTNFNKKSFDKALAIDKTNNYDGIAIDAAFKDAKMKSDNRLVIVLSDGQPNGYGYGGSAGVNHTMSVIQKIRNQGVKIVSVSLVPKVMRDNNEIYGETNNFDGTNLKKLCESFQKILMDF